MPCATIPRKYRTRSVESCIVPEKDMRGVRLAYVCDRVVLFTSLCDATPDYIKANISVRAWLICIKIPSPRRRTTRRFRADE